MPHEDAALCLVTISEKEQKKLKTLPGLSGNMITDDRGDDYGSMTAILVTVTTRLMPSTAAWQDPHILEGSLTQMVLPDPFHGQAKSPF